jgi:hypothetical protein
VAGLRLARYAEPMSESSAFAYFLSAEKLSRIGRDASPLTPASLRKTHVGQVANDEFLEQILEAAEAMLAGRTSDHEEQVKVLAVWAVIDALTPASDKGHVGEPFFDLDELVALLKKNKKAPAVREAFERLSSSNRHGVPSALLKREDHFMPPSMTFIAKVDDALLTQSQAVASDFENDAEWTAALDCEPDEVAELLGWFAQAHERKTGLFLVYNFDL